MHSFLQDLRFGARMLRKNPGFAIAAILHACARSRRQYCYLHYYEFCAAERGVKKWINDFNSVPPWWPELGLGFCHTQVAFAMHRKLQVSV
jgi:hypothetical protein